MYLNNHLFWPNGWRIYKDHNFCIFKKTSHPPPARPPPPRAPPPPLPPARPASTSTAVKKSVPKIGKSTKFLILVFWYRLLALRNWLTNSRLISRDHFLPFILIMTHFLAIAALEYFNSQVVDREYFHGNSAWCTLPITLSVRQMSIWEIWISLFLLIDICPCFCNPQGFS